MRPNRGAFTLGSTCLLLSPLLEAAQSTGNILLLRNASVVNLESGVVESGLTIQVVEGLIQTVGEAGRRS